MHYPTSPMNRTPQSPVNKGASPRPPLHPRTQFSGFDSPRARSPSPRSGSRKATGANIASTRLNSLPGSNELRMSRETGDQHSRRRGSIRRESSRVIPRIKLRSRSLWNTVWKSAGLCLFMAAAVFVAATSLTGMSLNWLFSSGSIPIWMCPSEVILVGANEVVDGTFCKILITAESPQVMSQVAPGVMLDSAYYFGHAVIESACQSAPTLIDPRICTPRSWSDSHPSLVSACQYNVSPVCDAEGLVSVGKVIGLRGILIASLLIISVYATVSFACAIKEKAELVPNRQRRLDQSRVSADASAREMAREVEEEWDQRRSAEKSQFPSLVAETGTLRKMTTSRKDMFSSENWKLKVLKSIGPEARARRRVSLLLQKIRTGLAVFLIFLALTIAVMQLVLFVSPNNYYSRTVRSLFSVIAFDSSLLISALESPVVWIDFLSVADLAIELLFVLFCGALVVQWPQIPLKVPHLIKTRNAIRKGVETDFIQAADDGAIYSDSIAAVLVCRESCSSESKRLSFTKRLQTLLTMFPPESIFVVDSNPHSVSPVDSTWETVNGVSRLIRYCFVPDCDSKIFSLHWFNLVWLPFLTRTKSASPFSHFFVLMSPDEESPLPAVPLDLTIPRDSLILNSDNLRAIHYPVSAFSAGKSTFFVPWQDIEFKLKAVNQLAETKLGSATELELTVAVWEREALVRALEGAATKDLSPLQQLESSLAIIKLRGRNHIKSNPFAFVQTSVPARFTDLVSFQMRNNHAGEITRALAACVEIFSPMSLCNSTSWSIKIILLLKTIAVGLCQIIRPFVIASLVFRDPLAIAALAAIAAILIWLVEIILIFVFSNRSDLRAKWSLVPLSTYPLYRFFKCWLIEIPILFEYIMGGCVQNATLKPVKRFRELQDAPACPPDPIVNWFTVWKVHQDDDALTDVGIQLENGKNMDDSLSSLGGFSSPRYMRGA